MKRQRLVKLGGVFGLTLVLVLQSACFGILGGTTPTEKFAGNNKAFQIALQETDRVINQMLDARPPLIAPAAVVNLYEHVTIPLNNSHQAFLRETITFLQVDSRGREVLVLNEDGRLRLEALTQSLFTVSQAALNNFGNGLSSTAHANILLAIGGILPLVVQMQGLISQFKRGKDQPVSLRALVKTSPTAEVSVWNGPTETICGSGNCLTVPVVKLSDEQIQVACLTGSLCMEVPAGSKSTLRGMIQDSLTVSALLQQRQNVMAEIR